MTAARREYFLFIVGLLLLAATGAAVYYISHETNRARDVAEVRTLLTNFGQYEKSISLSGSGGFETLRRDIQQTYAPFVTEAILQQWRIDPRSAPRRLTSSPWPDRIEVDNVSPQGAGYVVSGRIMLMTNAGPAGEIPVVAQIVRENGEWQIAVYQEQNASR